MLNLAEALGRQSACDRAHFLAIALGSARETRAICDVAWAAGMIDTACRNALDHRADRICAMLYRLRKQHTPA